MVKHHRYALPLSEYKEEKVEITRKLLVVLLDVSKSMEKFCSRYDEALDVGIQIVTVLKALCERLGVTLIVYTARCEASRMDSIDVKTLQSLSPYGTCRLQDCLAQVWSEYGQQANYLSVSAGHVPLVDVAVVNKFKGIKLNVFALGNNVPLELLQRLGTMGNAVTMSFIKDMQDVKDHVIPIFIHSLTRDEKILDSKDKDYSNELAGVFTQLLASKSPEDILHKVLMSIRCRSSALGQVVEEDAESSSERCSVRQAIDFSHGGTEHRLFCHSHCHKHLIPGTLSSKALRYYQTPNFQAVLKLIQDIPATIGYHQRTIGPNCHSPHCELEDYSARNCFPGVGCDSNIEILINSETKTLPICKVKVGMKTSLRSCIRWIVKFHNLNATLFNGLTGSCPVWKADDICNWSVARLHFNPKYRGKTRQNEGPVYGIVLDSDETSIKINGHKVGALGVFIPGVPIPYFDTEGFRFHLTQLCEAGVIEVDARQFSLPEGLGKLLSS